MATRASGVPAWLARAPGRAQGSGCSFLVQSLPRTCAVRRIQANTCFRVGPRTWSRSYERQDLWVPVTEARALPAALV